jgi:hypothetical protein
LEPSWITVQHAVDWCLDGRVAPAGLHSLEHDPSLESNRRKSLLGTRKTFGRSPRQLTMPSASRNTSANTSQTPMDIVRNLEQTFQGNNTRKEAIETHDDLDLSDQVDSRDAMIEQLTKRIQQLEKGKCEEKSSTTYTDKTMFKPSEQQFRVHKRISQQALSGKVSRAGAHAFCEDLLAEDFYTLDPHPQLAICIYECKFGPGALSILHGKRVFEFHLCQKYDQSSTSVKDFSNKGHCPAAIRINRSENGYSALLLCIQNWIQLGEKIWVSEITAIFRKVKYVVEQFSNLLTSDMSFPTERFVQWIDVRLYKIRRALASEDPARLKEATSEIGMGHYSFDGVKMAAYSTKSQTPTTSSAPSKSGSTREKMPKDVSSAIPLDSNGKKACVRFWTVAGCKGKGDKCDNEHFSHIKPARATVNEKIISYITQRYGGLRADAFSDDN